MTATMTRHATSTLPALPTLPTVGEASVAGAVSGGPLVMLRLEGAAALVCASLAYSTLFLLPDLSMLGYLAGRRVGAASYNTAHSYLGPALLAALGAASGAHTLLLVACIWAAHVGFDRMLGYGLKYGTRFGDTHLGRAGLGKSR
jgi:hypothetical protein